MCYKALLLLEFLVKHGPMVGIREFGVARRALPAAGEFKGDGEGGPHPACCTCECEGPLWVACAPACSPWASWRTCVQKVVHDISGSAAVLDRLTNFEYRDANSKDFVSGGRLNCLGGSSKGAGVASLLPARLLGTLRGCWAPGPGKACVSCAVRRT
jgi:hypothetical protein